MKKYIRIQDKKTLKIKSFEILNILNAFATHDKFISTCSRESFIAANNIKSVCCYEVENIDEPLIIYIPFGNEKFIFEIENFKKSFLVKENKEYFNSPQANTTLYMPIKKTNELVFEF